MTEWILLAGIGAGMLALALGALGSFVVWNRMAYLGDTIAHASLLGVAISLMSAGHLPLFIAIAAVAVTLAIILTVGLNDNRLSPDAMIGILAHAALAISLLVLFLSGNADIDVEVYLFGNITAITPHQVKGISLISIATLAVLIRHWRALLMVTLDPAIAAVENISVLRTRLILTIMLAIVVAASITIVGALLVTALLIIPAAAARYRASTPRGMVLWSCALAVLSAMIGLGAASHHALPSGPCIVVAATVLLLLSRALPRR